jgi:hypothetical protein
VVADAAAVPAAATADDDDDDKDTGTRDRLISGICSDRRHVSVCCACVYVSLFALRYRLRSFFGLIGWLAGWLVGSLAPLSSV